MHIKELNKTQLVMLTVLLSFITSIATGIMTTALLNEAPVSVSAPVNKVIRETVEKIVTVENDSSSNKEITKEQEQLLEDLKYIKPLTVSLYKKEGDKNKLLGTGLLLGENKVIIASQITDRKDGEIYFVESVFGKKDISKITIEDDFTIIELLLENKNEIIEGNTTTENKEEIILPI